MFRKHSASSRVMRAGVLGLVTLTTGAIFTHSAEARRHSRTRHVVHSRHQHQDANEYSPKFSSIILDGNSGAVLTAISPDGIRHPASLTKIMTLYLLFERLESGQVKLDTQMSVSENASEQDPTKLGLRPGETIKVEDAIKGLVTRSANDAAVVIAESIGGSEDEFARMMTRKAHALGMSHTIYRNASGLPNDEQVTTARDQATLGRAIQQRFPRYYRYFSTVTFNYHGESIRNHNHLLGSVEGVDGIKTGYTRASGFNLVTSLHRGNHFLLGVVMGGHSGGSRDAIMRSLLAENLERGSTTRAVVAITEHDVAGHPAEADEPGQKAPKTPTAQSQAAPAEPASREAPALAARLAQAAAAAPGAQPKVDPAPLTSGVIETQPPAVIGSSEPMKPVRVKTVQVKAGQMKLASASPSQPATPVTSAVPPARHDLPETSSAVVSNAETVKSEAPKADAATERTDLPPQLPRFRTGNGVAGAVPTSSVAAMAYVAPAPQQADPQAVPQQQQQQPHAAQQNGSPIKLAAVHTGWIVQVGALESASEAQQRIEAARKEAHGLLADAEPFTEPVIVKGDRTLYRARFARLGRNEAEAVCRTLKRSDISCIAVKN